MVKANHARAKVCGFSLYITAQLQNVHTDCTVMCSIGILLLAKHT